MVRPWAGESTGPFRSRAVVSRVHRPSQEAFHSCFGTRNGRWSVEKRETEADNRDSSRGLAPPSGTTTCRYAVTMTIGKLTWKKSRTTWWKLVVFRQLDRVRGGGISWKTNLTMVRFLWLNGVRGAAKWQWPLAGKFNLSIVPLLRRNIPSPSRIAWQIFLTRDFALNARDRDFTNPQGSPLFLLFASHLVSLSRSRSLLPRP